MPQPTWLEMHAVRRRPSGISTASIFPPSASASESPAAPDPALRRAPSPTRRVRAASSPGDREPPAPPSPGPPSSFELLQRLAGVLRRGAIRLELEDLFEGPPGLPPLAGLCIRH